MIEANGNDKNGGIFSVAVDFTLLTSPPQDKIPTLLKKFGNWNTTQENWLKYPIYSAAKGDILLTASSNVSNQLLLKIRES